MAAYIAQSSYRSYMRKSSKTGEFLGKIASLSKSAFAKKNRACREARASRHSRSSTANYHSVRGRNSLSTLGEGKKNALKDVVNRFKGVKLSYEIGVSALIIGLMVVAIASSVFYLAYFNKVATKGYELKRLESDHQQLINQYEIKNLKLAEVKALKNIASSVSVSAMQRPLSVEFVHGNTAIASR